MKVVILFLSVMSLSVFASDGELKTKDLKNTEINPMESTDSGPSATPEQLEDMKKQIQVIKEKQRESEEYLKELDKE